MDALRNDCQLHSLASRLPHHRGDRLDGGMLYLPRLFVYHADTAAGLRVQRAFKVMERRLLKAIINPAMIAVWILGPCWPG